MNDRMKRGLTRGAVSLLALFAAAAVSAADLTIVVADGPGEGFNDPTPVAPVGGNPGTTLGAQRLEVFRAAARIWGDLIDSNVQIQVEARFDPLTCDAYSAVLGSAGTMTVHRDFVGAGRAATWYPQALANAQAGTDLSSSPDVGATFNSAIDDNDGCLGGTNWYLGLDGNAGNDIDLLDVVTHEMGHGLGFASFVDESTGVRFFNYDDIFSVYLEDHSLGLTWPEMSDSQRKASAVDTGDLHFIGPNVQAVYGHAPLFAPNPVQPGSSVSHFDTSMVPDELMEPYITDPPIHDVGLAYDVMLDLGWWPVGSGGNSLPGIGIDAPIDGSRFTDSDSILLAATADDAEDGDLSAEVAWYLNGSLIGNGASLAIGPLAIGSYTISAQVADSVGGMASDSVSISVVSGTAVVPPSAPVDVQAVDQQDGTALVTWVDTSGNEDGFDILRETPHPRRPDLWLGATLVGSVAADVTRFVDAGGTGTFRYCVSAVNAAGGSNWTCGAAVEVTDTGGDDGDSTSTFCDAHPDHRRCL